MKTLKNPKPAVVAVLQAVNTLLGARKAMTWKEMTAQAPLDKLQDLSNFTIVGVPRAYFNKVRKDYCSLAYFEKEQINNAGALALFNWLMSTLEAEQLLRTMKGEPNKDLQITVDSSV